MGLVEDAIDGLREDVSAVIGGDDDGNFIS